MLLKWKPKLILKNLTKAISFAFFRSGMLPALASEVAESDTVTEASLSAPLESMSFCFRLVPTAASVADFLELGNSCRKKKFSSFKSTIIDASSFTSFAFFFLVFIPDFLLNGPSTACVTSRERTLTPTNSLRIKVHPGVIL